MAGHSKWANIKHRKRAKDAAKSKLFSRLVREITMAAKQGGVLPESNPRLRIALQHAKSANLPRENITRAIQKGGSQDAAAYKEVVYEGYAAHGVGVIVECMTDNLNRTVAAVRSMFTKYGGSMGKSGSLAFFFDRKGVFTVKKELSTTEEDAWMLSLIEAGAQEIEEEAGEHYITCSLEAFGRLQQTLEDLKAPIEDASLHYVPNTWTPLEEHEATSVLRLVEDLEDHDDVQNVFHNMALNSA